MSRVLGQSLTVTDPIAPHATWLICVRHDSYVWDTRHDSYLWVALISLLWGEVCCIRMSHGTCDWMVHESCRVSSVSRNCTSRLQFQSSFGYCLWLDTRAHTHMHMHAHRGPGDQSALPAPDRRKESDTCYWRRSSCCPQVCVTLHCVCHSTLCLSLYIVSVTLHWVMRHMWMSRVTH